LTASIALPNLNVKIIGLYAGLFVGKNGARTSRSKTSASPLHREPDCGPSPWTPWRPARSCRYAAHHKGPMYMRIGRDPVPQFVPDDYAFKLGRSITLRAATT